MRTKIVPAPPEPPGGSDAPTHAFETVVAARRAIPLVPASAEDCCDRLLDRVGDRLDLRARDEAHEWLTFLTALELVVESRSGYRRPRGDLVRTDLAAAIREHAFGAREVLEAIEETERPLDAETAFERVREIVPTWERHHHADWEREWRERVNHLLDWLVVAGLAERVADGYRVA